MILLVNMPFAGIDRPSLSLGLLKALLQQQGRETRVLDLNLDLAALLGFGFYHTLSGLNIHFGDWAFAPHLSSNGHLVESSPAEFMAAYGLQAPDSPGWKDFCQTLERLRKELAAPFLEDQARRIAALEPELVGFSCSFQQTIASLALAEILRIRYGIPVFFGGASMHGSMGGAYARAFPWIEAIVTGEAEEILEPLVQCLSSGEKNLDLPGVIFPEARGGALSGPPARPVSQKSFSENPLPDYSDFFARANEYGLPHDKSWISCAWLPFETSRGCWWGEKNQCGFCGLNGIGMKYRVQEPQRALEIIRSLGKSYPVKRLYASDNNLAPSYFSSLIPELGEVSECEPLPDIFYSLKSGLDRSGARALFRAGIRDTGPGIENMSTPLLQLMGKGCDLVSNVHHLRMCREYGVRPRWNFLVGIPGEKEAHYRELEGLVPKLFHLDPPFGAVPILCYRFSLYHRQSETYCRTMKPAVFYSHLFAPGTIDLEEAAFVFDVEWKETLAPEQRGPLEGLIATWRERWLHQDRPFLRYFPGGTARIIDGRERPVREMDLSPQQQLIYNLVQDPISRKSLLEKAARQGVDGRTAGRVIEEFIQMGLAIAQGERVLALATVLRQEECK